jgi:hypothetical protein
MSDGVIEEGNYVAAEVRAAAVAVVDVAVRRVEESSVEVVAGTLAVELARAVGQVKLLNNSEHDVVCVRTRVCRLA